MYNSKYYALSHLHIPNFPEKYHVLHRFTTFISFETRHYLYISAPVKLEQLNNQNNIVI